MHATTFEWNNVSDPIPVFEFQFSGRLHHRGSV